jgi:hypothetical protein
MKKFIIPILVIVIVLMGGYIFWEQSNSSSSKDLFAKKKECQGLYNQAKNQVESKWADAIFDPQIENPKVYYSPKLDSCIYQSEVIQGYDTFSTTSATYYLSIVDLLNNQELVSVVCDSKASLVSEEYNNIPQHTSEDLKEYSQCTSPIHEKLEELEVLKN